MNAFAIPLLIQFMFWAYWLLRYPDEVWDSFTFRHYHRSRKRYDLAGCGGIYVFSGLTISTLIQFLYYS